MTLEELTNSEENNLMFLEELAEPIIDAEAILESENFVERKIFLEGEITPESIYCVIRRILKYNKDDKHQPKESRTPIKLYISSPGGDLLPGISLISVIKNSVTPVYTINFSHQYSTGFLIGLAGHKRFAMKDATFLLHDGDTYIENSTLRAHDQIKFYEKVEERIKRFVVENSNITEEEYEENARREWYLFGDEAKQKGFTDYIIDEDCNISAII